MFGIDLSNLVILFLCLGLVCAFEFVNGFHDTANAIAPVIYTNSLSPRKAVILAACMNFLGVTLGGITVAMGIIHLLPLDIIASGSREFGLSLVLALLIAAIIWNVGTWYLGLPASSSHTLIGSILGVSLALWYLYPEMVPDYHKAFEAFKSLFLSPIVGFGLAFFGMYVTHKVAKREFFARPGIFWHRTPKKTTQALLIATSAFVSFAHGSNDGQKGVGLAMLILISIAPSVFTINPDLDISLLKIEVENAYTVLITEDFTKLSTQETLALRNTTSSVDDIRSVISHESLTKEDYVRIRKAVLHIQKNYKMLTSHDISIIPPVGASSALKDREILDASIANITNATDYAPWWVIAMISLSLGLGSLVGWKRIVVTIGEKIGKEKLTYAQASVASMVTAITILTASRLGLPVSTTHIMSSGVAGTMSYEHGSRGLQGGTIRNILLAWALTLPVSMMLAAGLFIVFLKIFN